MQNKAQEILTRLSALQAQVWQTVASTLSEAVGVTVVASEPLTASTSASDIYSESGSPRLVIQFSFANLPEDTMLVLLSEEAVLSLYNSVSSTEIQQFEDGIVTELRPVLESIVQGICLAAGHIKSEPTVASGLNIRYSVISLPPSLQKSDTLYKVAVSFSSETPVAQLSWILNQDVACSLLGMSHPDEDALNYRTITGSSNPQSGDQRSLDDTSLEIIMDIPLEVSVELGRVKMPVKEVIDLGAGSIVEIDKAAGEPVDVLVNGRLVARGEVVVIDDNFGVRITEIVPLNERLQKLNEAA